MGKKLTVKSRRTDRVDHRGGFAPKKCHELTPPAPLSTTKKKLVLSFTSVEGNSKYSREGGGVDLPLRNSFVMSASMLCFSFRIVNFASEPLSWKD